MKNLMYILIALYSACFLSLSAEPSEDEQKESKGKKGPFAVSDISSFNTADWREADREGLQRTKEITDRDKISERAEVAPRHSSSVSDPQWGLMAEENKEKKGSFAVSDISSFNMALLTKSLLW